MCEHLWDSGFNTVHHGITQHRCHKRVAKRYALPILPVCPVHQTSQALLDAKIWLATPASLLASSPQRPFIQERMRFIELVMWSADVVLVDQDASRDVWERRGDPGRGAEYASALAGSSEWRARAGWAVLPQKQYTDVPGQTRAPFSAHSPANFGSLGDAKLVYARCQAWQRLRERAEEFVKRSGFVLMVQVAGKDKRAPAELL